MKKVSGAQKMMPGERGNDIRKGKMNIDRSKDTLARPFILVRFR